MEQTFIHPEYQVMPPLNTAMPNPMPAAPTGQPVFPGPTPSPFPPSPMMPGPDMQQGAMPADAEGGSGHSCGKSHPESDPAAPAMTHPTAATQPYFHDQLQYGVYGYPPLNQATQPYPPVPAQTTVLGLNLQDQQFWKGALIGTGLTLLVTNDSVQKAVMKGVSSIFSAAKSGVEEMKEKYEDIQAEMKQTSAEK